MTSTKAKPRLSIGLPVFNGERYLPATLDSILGQTFSDFELIISDNASTDGTQRLCLDYAAKDARVRYHRSPTNIGATQNWYRVLDLASADYFASVAHDDCYEPDYMRRCIEVLDRDPSVAVCFSRTKIIDESGAERGVLDVVVDTTSENAHDRLYQLLKVDYLCVQLYGVMRTSILRSTKVFSGYYGCDRNTLAELCLLGKIQEIPEPLFIHRLYPDALGNAVNSGRSTEELSLIDPGTDWRLRSTGRRIFLNYFSSVNRLVSPIGSRARCHLALARLLAEKVGRRSSRVLRRLRFGPA